MHETTLSTLTPAELAAAYNLVYSDYVVPFVVSEAWARQYVPANGIALEHSPLWLDDNGAVVALAALGVRGERGWVGGFGVAPDHRGQGLSQQLARVALDHAREVGLRQVQLEVITTNARAIRTYERVGFVRTRDLLILTFPADAPRPEAALPTAHAADPATLIPYAARLGAVTPCWQRELERFVAIPDLRGLALGAPDSPDAYLVYLTSDTSAQIQVIAGASPAALAALVQAFAAQLPGRALAISNEPEESPVCSVLVAAGWSERLRQHEMVCELR
jgi:GNAT superfamily N-acetyltransferase